MGPWTESAGEEGSGERTLVPEKERDNGLCKGEVTRPSCFKGLKEETLTNLLENP